MELLGADSMSADDWGRPVRDDYQDWQASVDRAWQRRERLGRLDERWVKDGEPVEEDESERAE